MIFRHLVVGPLEGNCYIIGEEISHSGIIIDPGGDPEKILQVVKETGLTIRFFLATHGHFDDLYHSIKHKLFTLPDNTVVYPGHDEPTTIGDEKNYNFYL
jgi:glyoxylase-like metal-dependent hydrolase (beta-lactamase superfamily II)